MQQEQRIFPADSVIVVSDSNKKNHQYEQLTLALQKSRLGLNIVTCDSSTLPSLSAAVKGVDTRVLAIVLPINSSSNDSATRSLVAQQFTNSCCLLYNPTSSNYMEEIAVLIEHQFTKVTTKIHFYNSNEPFYEFTNFYLSSIVDSNSTTWICSENYFQGQKFVQHPDLYAQAKALKTPRAAFDMARIYKNQVRNDWQLVKMGIMQQALEFKFSQNKELHRLLLATGNAQLFEHTVNDNFWGDGGDEVSGSNQLGKLLMQVRTKLRNLANK